MPFRLPLVPAEPSPDLQQTLAAALLSLRDWAGDRDRFQAVLGEALQVGPSPEAAALREELLSDTFAPPALSLLAPMEAIRQQGIAPAAAT